MIGLKDDYMSEKISVIVPVYNAERFLKRCANSILNQTYKNIELILVNDGSKDNSLSLCHEIAKSDERVVVVDKQNGGAASARNKGLDYATGEYIGFCDSDDFLDLDMYETLKKIMDENNLDMVDSRSKVYDEDEHLLYKEEETIELEIVSSEEYIKRIFQRKGNVSLCSRLFRSSLIKDLRITEGRRVEDFYFIIQCLTMTKNNATYFYPFYNYVTNPNGVTHKATGSIYLDGLFFYNLALKLLDNCTVDMKTEQTYYLLKMYYLLSISTTKDEHKKFSEDLKECQRDIRRNFTQIGKNPYLKKKEKLVLYISCISMKISRILFNIKNGGTK